MDLSLAAGRGRPAPTSSLANDPDADRLAVAVPTRGPAAGGCSPATRWACCWPTRCCRPPGRPGRDRLVATRLVSSQLLGAHGRGAPASPTRRRSPGSSGSSAPPPTGRTCASCSATRRRSATASATSCATRTASAPRCVVRRAGRGPRRPGAALADRLDELARQPRAARHPAGARSGRGHRRAGTASPRRWRAAGRPPAAVAGRAVDAVRGPGARRHPDGCRRATSWSSTSTAPASIVRPSGTEPKLKVLPRGRRAGRTGEVGDAAAAAADARRLDRGWHSPP